MDIPIGATTHSMQRTILWKDLLFLLWHVLRLNIRWYTT